MKKLLTILLVAITFNCFSQASQAKPYICDGDSLYKMQKYNKAFAKYQTALQFDRSNKYPQTMMDSCNYYITKKQDVKYDASKRRDLVKQLKDKKIELIFDTSGNVVRYQKEGTETKPISDMEPDTYAKVKTINKVDWENYK